MSKATVIGFRCGLRLAKLYELRRDKTLPDGETDYAAAAWTLRQVADEIELGQHREEEPCES